MTTITTCPEEQAILIRNGWMVGIEVRDVAWAQDDLVCAVRMLDAEGLKRDGAARSLRFRGKGGLVLRGVAGGRVPRAIRVAADGTPDERLRVTMKGDGWEVAREAAPGECLWCLGPGECAQAPATLLRGNGKLRAIAARVLQAPRGHVASRWDGVVSPVAGVLL